ncbi:hypothetical protein J2847_004258 [Azospirillum agricola]|uniref:hypothetical protein n=1 Tax=Azospirillum agricola TaxID=1720247 RepID=UPI001AE30A33|nr:hypothetical protein [Azospirillum agricola]MBP2230949.1 hypothetical protein [Azospirillum agricola]
MSQTELRRAPAVTARDDPAPASPVAPSTLDLLFAQLQQRIGTANRVAEPPDRDPPEKQR